MTAQFPDKIEFDSESFTICDMPDGPPFLPAKFGLKPQPASTACRRGFTCEYALLDKRIHLSKLQVYLNLSSYELPPILNEESPIPYNNSFFDYIYYDVNMFLPFNGVLIVGRGNLNGNFRYAGLPPAHRFENVYKLNFSNGELVLWEKLDIQTENPPRNNC